jgi:hypothetical protein
MAEKRGGGRKRLLYVTQRIKNLREELVQLQKERQELRGKPDGEKGETPAGDS